MNRPKTLILPLMALLAVLGCLDTAHAQPQLTVTPSSVTNPATPLQFTAVSGGISPVQTITLSSSSSTTVLLLPQNTPWLTFPNGFSYSVGPSGTTINIRANAAGLTPGTQTGSFNIAISQVVVSTVYVSFTVGSNSSVLNANPSSLSFTAQQGALTGQPQTSDPVKITSSGGQINYSISTQIPTGEPNWIQLSATSGTTGDAGFTVGVAPPGLGVGTHNGTIIVQSLSGTDAVSISVTLTISASSVLTVTPANPPPFIWQVNTANPPARTLTVTSSGGTIPYNVRLVPAVNWLVVTQSGTAGASPGTITLTPNFNGAGLSPGQTFTNVVVTPAGGADLPGVTINLVVTQNPVVQVSSTSLAFTGQFNSPQAPPDQQVQVTASSSVQFSFTSDAPWLSVAVAPSSTFGQSGASTTNATLVVHANPTGLSLGQQTGTITVRPTGEQYSLSIPVTFTIVGAVSLNAGPGQLLFSFQTGQNTPSSQNVLVQSSGQPVTFSLSASTNVTQACNTNWLSATATSSTTPATLSVSVLPAGIAAGNTCTGTVKLDYNNGTSATSLNIPVALAVSSSAELVVSMASGFGVETAVQGSGIISRQISLFSTDPNTPVPFSVSASSSPTQWLFVGTGPNAMTPQTLTVQIVPGSLTPGVYTGSINISSTSLPNFQLTIPVQLTITSNVTVTTAPTSLNFTEAQNGPLPASQNLTLTSTGGTATFIATVEYINANGWLQVTPSSGSASGQVQVSIAANSLSPGDYNAKINFAFQGASTTSSSVNVKLHVDPPQTITVSPQTLNFTYQMGGAQPASQKLTISGSGSPSFTVGTTSTGGWLSADVTSGTAPKEVNISVNTQNLGVNTYNGTVTVSSPALSNPVTVNVTLTVTALPPPQPIRIFNAGSGVAGVISAGEIITITGNQLGPSTAASFKLNSSGGVDSTLAGVRVLFDNNPGTPIYVSTGQINVIVPYEINGRLSTTMVVENNGVQSAPFQLSVAPYALGLFTNNFSGTGQVAALNQNGTYNGVGSGFTPAPQGSIIQVYGTGAGQTNPASATGSVTPIPTSAAGLLRIPGTITATVGGVPAVVEFAGAAPGLVTGAVQFNVHLPSGVTGNAVSLVITINQIYSSPLGTTIAIQ